MVFGLGGSGNRQPFQIVTFDTSILADVFNARINTGAGLVDPFALGAQINDEPAVIPPWQLDEEPKTLARRINEVRAQEQFLNLNSSIVESAGDNVDRRATFALFEALEALETLAQFAAEANTPEASLLSLDTKFQQGLTEIQNFIGTAELDKLNLLFGKKTTTLKPEISAGKDPTQYVGGKIINGSVNDVISGLDGTEQFDITLTKGLDSDTISIDLSQITGDLTVQAIIDHVNAQIEALPLLDEQGDPVLDSGGDPVSKYLTRFSSERDEDGNISFVIKGTLTETAKLSATDPAPSLFLASNLKPVIGDGETITRLRRLDDVDTAFRAAFRDDFAAFNSAQTDLNQKVAEQDAEAGEDVSVNDVKSATTTGAIATDSEGNVYAVGTTGGDLGTQLGDGKDDVYLTKFSSTGEIIYSRLLGTHGEAEGLAIHVDSDDNVIIAGQTSGGVSSNDALSGEDSFIVKFTSDGDEVFRRQIDTVSPDAALTLTTNATGDVIVAGHVKGQIGDGFTSAGGQDAYILRLDTATGTTLDRTQFGTSGADRASAITVGNDGSIYVASTENGEGIIRKFDGTDLTNELASHNLGNLNGGQLSAIAIEGTTLVVGGSTASGSINGGSTANSFSAGKDAFVTTFNTSLNAQSTRFLGTGEDETLSALDIQNGKIFVAGTTAGDISADGGKGVTDTFVARINASDLSEEALEQYGSFGNAEAAAGLAFTNTGASVLGKLGLQVGNVQQSQTRDLTTQTSVREGDFFYVSVNGREPHKITIREGETLRSLAVKLNSLDIRTIDAEVRSTSTGNKLELKVENGGSLSLIAGDGDKDALSRLGLEPAQLLSSELLFEIEDDEAKPEDTIGGTFALNLEDSFHIRDKQTARYVLGIVGDAVATIQRAFRSLTFDPIAFSLKEQAKFSGAVPAHLSKQLANYQDALFRLQGASLAPSQGFNI